MSKNSFAEAMSAASAQGDIAHFHPPSVCIASPDSAVAQAFIPPFFPFHFLPNLFRFLSAPPSFSLQLQQLLVSRAGAETVPLAEVETSGIGEAAEVEQIWFIIKSNVGRCGDGIQVLQP